ncbi:MAG: hypothetical protein J6K04_11380 [Lachnospiraceae bacterium]|nr:hypothetical protein [Lachnospiraceae bacterium]
MTEVKRNRRKRSQNGAVAVMVTLILLIIMSTALLFLPEKEPKKKTTGVTPTSTPTGVVTPIPAETEQLAVVLAVDTEVKMITVYDVVEEEEQRLVYTGASTFFDGYGVQLTAAQLEKGGLYRFTIDTKEEWISTACEAVDRREKPQNTDVWEKTGVDYMVIGKDRISFRDQNYRYSEKVCVINNGKQVSLYELEPTVDVVTVRGVGQVIYEIVVTKGHGYLSLENYEDFIGGTIAIGNTKIDSVSGNATYLVREGTYQVTVERGEYTGTEEVTVIRDATTVFDVFPYGRGPIEKGWLTIQIDPLGATLYIDGEETLYTDGVELEYGTYEFEFSEGGYTSYKSTVLINQPKQSLSVFLTEQPVEGEEEDDDPTSDPGEENDDPDNGGESSGETGTGEENTGTGDDNEEDYNGVQTTVSITNMPQYELNRNNAIYILGPSGAEIYLDGEYLGRAPIDFEKIIGSYVITIIRNDGAVKNFNCSETDNGEDSYYNFSWID